MRSQFLRIEAVASIFFISLLLPHSSLAGDIFYHLGGVVEVRGGGGKVGEDWRGISVLAIPDDPRKKHLQTSTKIDHSYGWVIQGTLNGGDAELFRIEIESGRFVQPDGAAEVHVTSEQRRHTNISLIVRTRENAKSYVYDKANELLREVALSDPSEMSDEKKRKIIGILDRALSYYPDPVVMDGRADFLEKIRSYSQCSEGFRLLAKQLSAGQIHDWSARAWERSSICMRKRAENVGTPEAWKDVARRSQEALESGVIIGKSRAALFANWLDALFVLSGANGDSATLSRKIFSDSAFTQQWVSLFYTHLKHVSPPVTLTEARVAIDIRRLSVDLGRGGLIAR